MKRAGFIFLLMICSVTSIAQQDTTDTLATGIVTVEKDPRIDVLGRKMTEYNEALASRPTGIRSARGYRLMMLSTTNRQQALNVRARLLQLYPDQKVYMSFQSPYIKVKFGNFLDKSEAEQYQRQLKSSELVPNNIYIVAETIEVKIDKNAPPEE
jgi:hypothetical protein